MLRFIIDDPKDAIQEHWTRNEFYEQEELDLLKQHVLPGAAILDIGANVGNHSIYFDKFFEPKVVYVVEPVMRAYQLLLQNVALNYCHSVNLDYIATALSNKPGHCDVLISPAHNLGGTRLVERGSGQINTVTGDSLFADKTVDFIKIDVEGMELQVLQGLAQTVDKNHPLMFVEVDNNNHDAFWNLMSSWNYQLVDSYTRYSHCKNFLVRYELPQKASWSAKY